MKSIAVFNNKGGVGKTTLAFHAAHALAELGHRTLLVDLDPQSNLTLFGLQVHEIDDMWASEEPFIDDFAAARGAMSQDNLATLSEGPHSLHFLLKPTEDGTAELPGLPPPVWLSSALGLLPGRLSLHTYEDRIASRWSDAFRGDPLAVRTITRIRSLCEEYARLHNFQYVLIDTSPSLGILNKAIISTSDGFLVPCGPDVFSLYGIRNIGRALEHWRREFSIMRSLLSTNKQAALPERPVQFLGFTIYKAKKYSGQNQYDLAKAHYNYAQQIPEAVLRCIAEESRRQLSRDAAASPVGGTAVMHTHETLSTMAQKYRRPIWSVPSHPDLDSHDKPTISGNRGRYESTQGRYHAFAADLLSRIDTLG